MNKIKITYYSCECEFCKKYNLSKGYFLLSDNYKRIKTNISMLISVIRCNEVRFMFYLHFIAYDSGIIDNKLYEKMLKLILKGKTNETRLAGDNKKGN